MLLTIRVIIYSCMMEEIKITIYKKGGSIKYMSNTMEV